MRAVTQRCERSEPRRATARRHARHPSRPAHWRGRLRMTDQELCSLYKQRRDSRRDPPCTTSNGSARIPRPSTAACSGAGCRPNRRSGCALDERRRKAILNLEQAQARRNAASKEIGAAKKNKDEAAARQLMAEVAHLKDAIPALEAEEKKVPEGAGRHPRRDPEPAGRRGARRQRRDRQCRAPSLRRQAQLFVRAEAAFRTRRSARSDGFRDRGKTLRRALRRAEERACPDGARARPVHARPAHHRARLHRDRAAAAGARRGDVRHRAIAEVRRISSTTNVDWRKPSKTARLHRERFG